MYFMYFFYLESLRHDDDYNDCSCRWPPRVLSLTTACVVVDHRVCCRWPPRVLVPLRQLNTKWYFAWIRTMCLFYVICLLVFIRIGIDNLIRIVCCLQYFVWNIALYQSERTLGSVRPVLAIQGSLRCATVLLANRLRKSCCEWYIQLWLRNWLHGNSANDLPNSKTDTWPVRILSIASLLAKHSLYYGYLNWFESYIQWAVSLADIKRGVYGRDVSGVQKIWYW